MNVLFIGNSYTHMNKMPEMFRQMATSKKIKINVKMSAKSSHTFEMHAKRPGLYEDINSGKWDYVILQGFSRELAKPIEEIDTASIPFINQILDSLYKNNPCVKVLLYMTWGYKTGIQGDSLCDTYSKMTDQIEYGYRYIGGIFDLPIIPVGRVWEKVRNDFPHINLYQGDEQHPTEYGSFLAASTIYSSVFRTSPELLYIPDIDIEKARLIQETAHHYVKKNLSECKLDRNIHKIFYQTLKSGKFKLSCSSNYPNSTFIEWDFGDGTTSNKYNVTHYYKQAGKYTVRLTIHDNCGVRIINKYVYFNEPPVKKKKN
jgi:hypothetical protein